MWLALHTHTKLRVTLPILCVPQPLGWGQHRHLLLWLCLGDKHCTDLGAVQEKQCQPRGHQGDISLPLVCSLPSTSHLINLIISVLLVSNSIPASRDQIPSITRRPNQLHPLCMSQATGLLQATPGESNYLGSELALPIYYMLIGLPGVTPNRIV